MSVSSICPSFTPERDLAHPDLEVRESAVRYVRELADLASAVGAPLIIIASTAFLTAICTNSEPSRECSP